MKTEPDTFSIDDLQRVGTEPWNGVRNYQARNHMRAMQPGDGVFLYHSSCAGARHRRAGDGGDDGLSGSDAVRSKSDYFDAKSTREDPRWSLVDVQFERKLAHRSRWKTSRRMPTILARNSR
jgi:predicted RNA-binding protein with PUA-like domain